jgi:hypothetical protein
VNRPRTNTVLRTVEDLADAKDLRAAVSASLDAGTIEDDTLRCAVWNLVGNERRAGVPPAMIIVRLTALIDESKLSPAMRLPLTRRVILWCVEEYFGHLGGTALDDRALADVSSAPSM